MLAGLDVARGVVACVRALGVVGNYPLRGTGETVTAFVRRQGIQFVDVLVCTDPEVEDLLRVAEVGPPCLFRIVPIYARWSALGRIIAGNPSRRVLRRWRRDQQQQREDSDEEAPPDPASGEHVGPLLYLPPGEIDQVGVTSRNVQRLRPEIVPVRLVNSLGVLRHLRSPKYFIAVLDDTYEYLFQGDEARCSQRRGDKH